MFQQTDVKVKEKISKIPFMLMSDGVTRNIKQELVMLVAVLSNLPKPWSDHWAKCFCPINGLSRPVFFFMTPHQPSE